MNLISCNYNCKFQREGYCCLNDISPKKYCGNKDCIYFEPNEADNDLNELNFLDDSELL